MWGLRAQTAAPVTLFWPDAALLEELELELPMMQAGEDSSRFENDASMAAGLTYRSLSDTARDTLEWWHSQSEERRANPRRWPDPEKVSAAIERIEAGS